MATSLDILMPLRFTLKNVFYVNNINKNIISVTKLIQQSYKIVFFYHNNNPIPQFMMNSVKELLTYMQINRIYLPYGYQIIKLTSKNQILIKFSL